MELTGKCEVEFEKWYIITYFKHLTPLSIQEHCAILECFDDCFESMQYGVYVDFFDSVEMDIVIERRRSDLFLFVIYSNCLYGSGFIPDKQSRPKARTSAIEKANELYNELY